MQKYKIHGDNIVECERMFDLILRHIKQFSPKIERGFSSLSCPNVSVSFNYMSKNVILFFEFYPGFNKNSSDRWSTNILSILSENGSFLDEAPDIVMTKEVNAMDEIIAAVEFCSALQAGNQAWQRSGRAFSTARTGIPYFYIVDFVKYELDEKRGRKNLRFPNPVVPFSYITHSIETSSLVIQAYFRAEEFQKNYDVRLALFDESIFSEDLVSEYFFNLFFSLPNKNVEQELIDRNFKMVQFLSELSGNVKSFEVSDWNDIYSKRLSVIDYSVKLNKFNFSKKIADKSKFGKVDDFISSVKKHSIGVASTDLPFGVIPKEKRRDFLNEVSQIYNVEIESDLLEANSNIVVCMLKGFKPRGDDNRPDRGALPLIAMLCGENSDVLTFVYGPIIDKNLVLLDSDPLKLANQNGLWKTFISLSNIIILDSPNLNGGSVCRIVNNTSNKLHFIGKLKKNVSLVVDPNPKSYQENDVDTILHTCFKHNLSNVFEGMCNPPGGDWSGLSIISNGSELRWLSLPRINPGLKRPDHLFQLFRSEDKDKILIIESKEKPSNLEKDVGQGLRDYFNQLVKMVPSVIRDINSLEWNIASNKVNVKNYDIITAAAFIVDDTFSEKMMKSVCNYSKCDLVFCLSPNKMKSIWLISIYADNKAHETFANELVKELNQNLNGNHVVFRLVNTQ